MRLWQPLVNEALTPTPALPSLDFLVTPTNTPLSATPTPTRTAIPSGDEAAPADDALAEAELTPAEADETSGTPTPVPETPTAYTRTFSRRGCAILPRSAGAFDPPRTK